MKESADISYFSLHTCGNIRTPDKQIIHAYRIYPKYWDT